MIKYEWRSQLSEFELVELSDMLDRAAQYDAEPEYSTISFADIEGSLGREDGYAQHLVIWMLPYATALGEGDQREQIAGILRLISAPDGVAHASLVIEPRLRSIGITTLLLERIGLDCSGPHGWAGSGAREITSWAQGNHPAAGRISNRFLIPRTRRVWKLIRPSDEGPGAAAAPVLEQISAEALSELDWAGGLNGRPTFALRDGGRISGVAAMNFTPSSSEEFGACATLAGYRAAPTATVRARRALLDGAAAVAQDKDFAGLIIYVDSDDAQWVNACRLNGFQHDRTDVRFQIGGQ